MKKILTTIATLLLLTTAAYAQEVIYLRDGTVVEGSVMEQQNDEIVKIRMRNGGILLYHMSEVECIIKDNADAGHSDGGGKMRMKHKGLDFNLDLGYNVATAWDDCDKMSLHLGLGKRFTQHFYWGVGTGFMMLVADLTSPVIPVTSDFRLYFPIRNKSVAPGGLIRLGYGFNTERDTVIKMEQYKQTIKAPNYLMLQIMPTIVIAHEGKSEFVAGVGYTHMIATVGKKGRGMVSLSVGFNIGKPMTYYRSR